MTQESETAEKIVSEPRKLINALVGKWSGMTKTWFEPDELADESEWTGEIRLILDGLYALYEYTGTLCGHNLKGMALIGYNPRQNRFESSWVDNNHTGAEMLISQGEAREGEPISYLGHYIDPSGGPDWGWRTEFTTPDPDTLVVTAYNIPPGGTEAKAVETVYRRVTS